MRIRIAFYSFCFLLLSCATINIKAQSKPVHVVLLGGQSNMAGHGDYDKLSEGVKKRIEHVSHRVLLSTSDNPKIEPRPLSFYISDKNPKYNFNKHFGPELFIGLTLAEANPKQEYLLIKKAVGGTSLYGAWNVNWSIDKALDSERGKERQQLKLYKAHIKNIDVQLKRLSDSGKTFKILGMTWMQGESDTNKNITASSYAANLKVLISAYRTHYNLSEMPFVIGQVNTLPRKFKEGPYLVRSGMQSVANSDENIDIVNTSTNKSWIDYPKHSDNLHYNVEGQKRLGEAFGEKLIELNK